jgi:hypothetical protein
MRQIISLYLLLLISCISTKNGKVFNDYSIVPIKMKLIKDQNALDSNTGNLQVSGLNINFDEGKSIYQGPQDEVEYFLNTFRQTYYVKFFNSLYIDSKVQKQYRDSVHILEYSRIEPGQESSCMTCNIKAVLKFRNMIYPYYTFYTKELIEKFTQVKIERDTINGFVYKTFDSKEEKGGIIYPLNRSSTINKLSLILNEGNLNEFNKFFKTIRPKTK